MSAAKNICPLCGASTLVGESGKHGDVYPGHVCPKLAGTKISYP